MALKEIDLGNVRGPVGPQGPPGETYTHPSTHPATMITEDELHRFLTDIERAVIQSWEDFKANGGVIGKELTVDQYLNTRGIKTKEPDGTLWMFGNLTPWAASNEQTIGLPGYPFKDIFLNGHSKNPNGYTKLPNGLILQWGKMYKEGEEARSFEIYPNFPISFPNACLTFVCTVGGEDQFTNQRDMVYYAVALHQTQFKVRASSTGEYAHTVERAHIQWFAIGY